MRLLLFLLKSKHVIKSLWPSNYETSDIYPILKFHNFMLLPQPEAIIYYLWSIAIAKQVFSYLCSSSLLINFNVTWFEKLNSPLDYIIFYL